MSPLSAVVVGGGVGGRLSLAALLASDEFSALAVADISPLAREALQRDFPQLRIFTDHEVMFEACPADVVCISTYAPSHEAVLRAALERRPRGVLVEKPLGDSYASGRRVIDAVRERHIPIAVPHGLVARRTPLEVIERVQRGDIGELELVEVQCSGWDILSAGIHWLHFFVTLIAPDEVVSVMACCDTTSRTFRDGIQVETVAITSLETRSGVRFVMHTGDEIHINREGVETLFRLVGTRGILEFHGFKPGYTLMNGAHPTPTPIKPPELDAVGHRKHLEALAQLGGGESRSTNGERITDQSA